jgi:hypothetical protein
LKKNSCGASATFCGNKINFTVRLGIYYHVTNAEKSWEIISLASNERFTRTYITTSEALLKLTDLVK